MPNPNGNPAWFKGCPATNTTSHNKNRDRFKTVQKRSSLEKKIALYLTQKWTRMISDLDSLSEKDRAKCYLELLQYCTPKKAAAPVDSLSPEQIELLYQKVSDLANAKSN